VTVLERTTILPEPFARWFAGRGWTPRAHQLELLAKAHAGRSVLLIAPTGGGKTLAGFLPSLVELSGASIPLPSHGGEERRRLISTGRGVHREGGLHTLYISPLKALAVDIARNLETPIAEMALPIRIETRTGDTPTSKRQRQRRDPPQILLTTPEQVALLLASADAPYLFGSLKHVILDELHALVTSKRGDLLSLGLARLFRLAPDLTSIGLSATVAAPDDLCRFMVPQRGLDARADLIVAEAGAAPDVSMLDSTERLPWAGHSARYALGEMYQLIKAHRTTLVFVNTRSQAEGIFQDLWHINDDNLAIALHHGSLDVAQRRKVEGAMASGRLRAVVCTSSLDLGVDWGDVDLVVNVGAPKGASRLLQRIGRANHRMDEPSKGVLIPANRFEVLECRAALDAIADNAQDAHDFKKQSQSMIGTWAQLSQNTARNHLLLQYREPANAYSPDTSSEPDSYYSLKYNAYPDKLLGLNLIPQSILTEEANFYKTQGTSNGIPLDPRHTYTKADWELWTAASSNEPTLTQNLIDEVYNYANTSTSATPFPDLYDTISQSTTFSARPVMGGAFAPLTLTLPPVR